MDAQRCSGHCCQVFFLPFSMEEIRRRVDADLVAPREDGPKIRDMVIPLGKWSELSEERKAMLAYVTSDPNFDPDDAGHYYTCKHYDQDTSNCQIYDERPHMCRAYPYEEEGAPGCRYTGCTMKGGCGVIPRHSDPAFKTGERKEGPWTLTT